MASSALPDITYLSTCDYKEFVEKVNELTPELLEELANVLKKNYFNSPNPIPFSDERYDYVNYVVQGDEGDEIGAPVSKEEETKLPTHLGSLDKIKTEKELKKFIVEGAKSYTVTEKLDGVSCLYYKNELFTRGNGDYGTKLTGLMKYLMDQDMLPLLPKDSDYETTMVRGELVISKEKFHQFKDDFSCPRNFVSGIVNSKEIPERSNQIELVAHELITQPPMSITLQLKTLKKMGFTVVRHATIKSLNISVFEKALELMKSKSRFEIDGIVIQESDGEYSRPKMGNPKYVFAFKKNIFVSTTVKEVLWKQSKRGQIKPTIRVEQINLSGAVIEYATGKNAKFIRDNNIGPGAIVSITRSGDVIPFIDRVIQGTIAQMPDIPYTWNETETDILVDDIEGDEVKIALINNFFKELGIKYFGEKTIKKLYEGGFHSAIDIVHASESDIASVIGEGNAKRARIQIDEVFGEGKEVDQASLMSASGAFGLGIGKVKLKLILDEVPDLLERKDFSDIEVKGIAEKTLGRIVEGIPKFNEFMKQLNDKSHTTVSIKRNAIEVSASSPLVGKTFVMTGFRDLESVIRNLGGKTSNKVSNSTTAVICIDKDSGTSKINDATKLGIPVLTREEFMEEYEL
jgi:DNA ligase (NAD+)